MEFYEGIKEAVSMIFDKATIKDIGALTDLRIAYLQEDLEEITDTDLDLIKSSLPGYYENTLIKI